MHGAHIAAMILAGSPAPPPKRPIGSGDPLAPIAGRSVVGWVIDAVLGASIRRVAVVGGPTDPVVADEIARRSDHALIEQVRPTVASDAIETVGRAIDHLVQDFDQQEHTHLLLLAAEAPQIEAGELRALIADHIESGAAATSLGAVRSHRTEHPIDPVISYSPEGQVDSIIEPLVVGGSSVFGAICIRAALLVPALRRITPSGWRHGPLVHDALVALEDAGHTVHVIDRGVPLTPIDSAATRAPVEVELRRRIVTSWLDRGVVFEDPARVVVDATVSIGHDVRIRAGTVLEGSTSIGDSAVIGPNTHLVDTIVGAGATVPSVVAHRHEIDAHAIVAPFSVLGHPPG